jgi:hypothetical protein
MHPRYEIRKKSQLQTQNSTEAISDMIMATDKMTTLVEENDTQRKESSPPPSQQGEVPSGFILKLFQMVNGAPDEVIAVSSTFF